jgi:hypothetical protein
MSPFDGLGPIHVETNDGQEIVVTLPRRATGYRRLENFE